MFTVIHVDRSTQSSLKHYKIFVCLYDDKRVLGKNLKENNWKKYIDGEAYAKVKGGMHSKRQESAYLKK